MKRIVVLGVLIAAGTGGMAVQQDSQPKVATIEKLRDNLYVIAGDGSGGNTAAFITSAGVVLVDTKNPGWGPAIMEKVRSVTDKPVTTIINTHTHGDHVGSNEYFPATVEVVAHENTKANMVKMPMFEGAKSQFLPDRTYNDRLTLLTGPDRIDLYYFGAGHTNGDSIIVFPTLRVAHTGDLFARPGTPGIDVNNGGSGVAYPGTLKKAASAISGVDTVIPGHSAVTTWQAFVEFGEFNAAFLSAVQQAIKDGKSADDAAAGLTLPEKFKSYTMTSAKDNVTKIYNELKSK